MWGYFTDREHPSRHERRRDPRLAPEVPGALAFLRWQFEQISPIIELFAGGRDLLFHQKLSPLAE